MQLILYSNFSKRKNSTKQPTGGNVHDVKLKNGCSVQQPVFLIDGIDLSVNYAQWNGRYYFITDIVLSNNNIYEIHCSVDVLATYKSVIGASTQFIARAAADYDDMIGDKLLTSTQEESQMRTASTSIGIINTTPGVYLINTFSDAGVNMYAYEDMAAITGIFNNSTFGLQPSNITALVQTIGMNLLDVSAYVTNCRWLPLRISDLSGVVEPVKFSFWELGPQVTDGKRITSRQIYESGTITMPNNQYSDYRAYDPEFSQYMLYLPGVGTVPIQALFAQHDINYTMAVDLFTGDVTYLLYTYDSGTYAHIGQFAGQLAVDVPYSTTNFDVKQMMIEFGTSNINAGQAMGGDYMGLARSAVEKVSSQWRTITEPQISIFSAAGNMSLLKTRSNIEMSVKNFGSKEFLLAEAGRPLCEHKQINTLSGFIQCSAATLENIGFESEKDDIISFMNSGFFYE